MVTQNTNKKHKTERFGFLRKVAYALNCNFENSAILMTACSPTVKTAGKTSNSMVKGKR